MEKKSNLEAGNIWAGWILGRLQGAWPSKVDISIQQVLENTKVSCEGGKDGKALFDLFVWLEAENYIRVGMKTMDGTFHNAHLTEKALAILNSVPPNIASKKSLGQQLKESVAEVGKETAKKQLGDLFGQVVGSAMRSFTQ